MTSVPGIYAVGDVVGGMMLAHRAAQQGKVVAANVCRYDAPPYEEKFIPSVVYSHPQIAHVGLSAAQAAGEGLPLEVVKSGYSANIIARTELLRQGFVKAVFSGDKIIGATIAGDNAAELIVPLSLVVSAEMTRQQMQNWIIPHPTLSEILLPLLG